MCCRSRPQYRSDLGWILGVAFLGTLTRSARPAQGFTLVRCCSLPSGFFPTRPHGARARASHDGDPCMQLPSARGCYQLAPQRTLTSNPVPMPGTPMARFSRAAFGGRRPLTVSKLRKKEASMRSTALPAKLTPPMMQCVSCPRNSPVTPGDAGAERRAPSRLLTHMRRGISLGLPNREVGHAHHHEKISPAQGYP